VAAVEAIPRGGRKAVSLSHNFVIVCRMKLGLISLFSGWPSPASHELLDVSSLTDAAI
jgi:hypothetical protein